MKSVNYTFIIFLVILSFIACTHLLLLPFITSIYPFLRYSYTPSIHPFLTICSYGRRFNDIAQSISIPSVHNHFWAIGDFPIFCKTNAFYAGCRFGI